MKIGILGSGDVGRTLGAGFAAKAHEVRLGSRSPGKAEVQEWLRTTKGRVSAGTFADAAAHGEIVVLCVRGEAAEAAVDLAGPPNLEGKVLLDVTNPLDFGGGMPPGLFVGLTDSLGERIQRRLPRSKIVKALNIVNHRTMVHPRIGRDLPEMLIAGDDDAAKHTVASLLQGFGWGEPIDLGGIENARWIEALVPLWVRIAMRLGTWEIAFKVLRA